ncbi:hypothetical protein APD01_05880 [Acinetobacter soli]|nr:hypothetical protein APD01_05880 [Acinetobacter soli]
MKAKTDTIPVQESHKQNSGRSFAFLLWILLLQTLLNSPVLQCVLSIQLTSNYVKKLLFSVSKYHLFNDVFELDEFYF